MFFDDPVAAFANIRAAVAPGAELAFACWRAEERDVFMSGLAPLAARMELPFAPPTVGVPGPLGLGTSVVIGDVLTEAGWFDVIVEALDVTLDYSFDGSDGVEERLAMALSGMLGRSAQAELEPRLGPDAMGGAARRGPRRTAATTSSMGRSASPATSGSSPLRTPESWWDLSRQWCKVDQVSRN